MNQPITEHFAELRNSLLNDTLLWIGIAAVPSVGMSVARILIIGWRPLFLFHLLLLAGLWILWLGQQRFSYLQRTFGLLLIAWTSIYAGLLQFGPLAFSGIHTILFAFIAILFLSSKTAFWLILGNTLCLIAFGFAASTHWLEFSLNYSIYAHHPLTWMHTVWSYSAFAVILAMMGRRMMLSLLDASIAAEDASKAKLTFISYMSHELRTPLNAIIGFAQLLRMNQLDSASATRQEAAGHILSSGQHLLTLINDILDLAYIESGTLNLTIENLELGTLVNEAIACIKPLATKHKITLNFECNCHSKVWVLADQRRLRQIILNLLSNAIKYNRPDGSVALICGVMENKACITISDTGTGIPEAQRTKLFQPFQRLGAEKSPIEGTGIGLTICKQLIATMAGEIGYKSKEGEGSQFFITLPLGIAEAPTKSQQGHVDSDMPKPEQIGGRVLYIEDSAVNIAVMKVIFKQLPGVELLVSESAEAGLALLQERKPDVILMDINLPELNWLQALNIIKQQQDTASIPVIAISAASAANEIKACIEAGFAEFISKPYAINEVLSLVKKHLAAIKK